MPDVTIREASPKTRAIEGILWYIRSHSLSGGDRLPSERTLSSELGVSRTALRSAISQLESSFVLESRQGSGTYVRARKPTFVLEETCSFSEAAYRAGRRPSSRLVSSEVRAADDRCARKMGPRAPKTVLELRRVRLVDETPVSIETALVNCELFPDLIDVDFESESLYAYLARVHGVSPAHGSDRISITRVRDDEASLLGVETGAAAFFQETISYDDAGELIEYCSSVVLPSLISFVSNGGSSNMEGEASRWIGQ